jgi:hypothetical protein
LVEGDEIGGRSVALIGNDEVTLVGGGVAARVSARVRHGTRIDRRIREALAMRPRHARSAKRVGWVRADACPLAARPWLAVLGIVSSWPSLRCTPHPTAAVSARKRSSTRSRRASSPSVPRLAENLDRLYTEDVHFRDPISEVTGLPELQRYFTRFAEVSAGARFEITDEVVQPGQAAVFWTMVMVQRDGSDGRVSRASAT